MTRRTYRNKEGEEKGGARIACTNQRQCGMASAVLDDVIIEVGRALEDVMKKIQFHIENDSDDNVKNNSHKVNRLECKLQELRNLEIVQWDEKTKGEMPNHVFEKLNSKILLEIEQTQQALSKVRDSVEQPIDWHTKAVTVRAALDALFDPEISDREKNILIKACINRIDYSRKYINVNKKSKKGKAGSVILDFEFTFPI